jgi:hypothetical protein
MKGWEYYKVDPGQTGKDHDAGCDPDENIPNPRPAETDGGYQEDREPQNWAQSPTENKTAVAN